MVIFVSHRVKIRMKDRGEERILVPMKLSGLGSAQSTPETMVILLAPVEEERYRLPNGAPMIYPVGVPPELAPIYFAKITQHFLPDGKVPEMSHFYELISHTKLKTLHIYQGEHGARPYLVFRDEKGEENSFRVSLINGILSAINHNLPILMEQKLLEAVASVVKVNLKEPIQDRPNKLNTISPMQLIYKEIEAGNKPNDPLSETQKRMLINLTLDEQTKLMERALELENYEWAAVLKDLNIGDE